MLSGLLLCLHMAQYPLHPDELEAMALLRSDALAARSPVLTMFCRLARASQD